MNKLTRVQNFSVNHSTPKSPESILIRSLRSEDIGAFKKLYRLYAPNLLGVILKIVNQQETAEDLLQDTFIKIRHNFSYYDEKKGSLFTWMLNISRNLAIDHLRRKSTRQQRFNSAIEEVSEELQVHIHEQNIDIIGLGTFVNALPERQRILIDLMYYKGFSQTDIAEELSIPLGTVKTQLRAAIMLLRKIYFRQAS